MKRKLKTDEKFSKNSASLRFCPTCFTGKKDSFGLKQKKKKQAKNTTYNPPALCPCSMLTHQRIFPPHCLLIFYFSDTY